MMYNIYTGRGGVPQVNNADIVILVSSLHQVSGQDLPFVFTDRHAYPITANYYNNQAFLHSIDWPLLQQRNFQRDPDDPEKVERYQAEALIYQHLPVQALRGAVCYTPQVQRELQHRPTSKAFNWISTACHNGIFKRLTMITYTQGNLLEADVDALVNTVNTVGVMGKGIALMFKARFPANMAAYAHACKAGNVQTGKMFITETNELMGPKWIVNFPTKQHWRDRSQMQWITQGLDDLHRFIQEHNVRSIAIPPLGAGNGGLSWSDVRPQIEQALGDLDGVDILIFEPTPHYQNITRPSGIETLTPARALIAELVRRYWVLGMECSLLEIQKLAWFLERAIEAQGLQNPLKLNFIANNYGPYADRLRHLLSGLDGSYLKSDKHINDCEPLDVIWFNDARRNQISQYLNTDASAYLPALEKTAALIDGFESPFAMELLSTVDWLLTKERIEPNTEALLEGLRHWPAGEHWAQRKLKLFDQPRLELALNRLQQIPLRAAM